MDYTSVTAY
ncbi:unnamed protein product, partial [Fusarium fujikuroi]